MGAGDERGEADDLAGTGDVSGTDHGVDPRAGDPHRLEVRSQPSLAIAGIGHCDDLDVRARQKAVSVLKSVGTKESLPYLERFVREERIERLQGLADRLRPDPKR